MVDLNFEKRVVEAILNEKQRSYNTQEYYLTGNNTGVFILPVTFDSHR